MGSMDFSRRIEEHQTRVIDDYDKIGGKALLVPGSASVSGARKILSSTQRDATLCIINPEVPIVGTGYENRYGDYSSSIEEAHTDYQIIAKISKYSFSPNHHYWLIRKDLHSNLVDVVERISCFHVTEKYGYLYNNSYIDTLNVGDIVKKGTTIRTSLAFDKYKNRMDGVNMNILYQALDGNMEDSVIISDVAASKMTAPLVKEVEIIINDNDIPINYYGTDDVYKPMPDIGEHTKDAILMILRKENKENALYAQSVDKLKTFEMNDDKYLLHGTVVDIDIFCNNPSNLESYSQAQFKMYYNENRRMSQEFITVLTPLLASGCTLSDELRELLGISKRVINGAKYIEKREFSNLMIRLTVLEELPLNVGDKISNRYGGKGVVSEIRPQALMPRTEDGEYADVLMNSSTMYNRENPFQLVEMEITRVGQLILKYIRDNNIDTDTALNLISTYVRDCNPAQANKFEEWYSQYPDADKSFLVDSMVNDGLIYVTVETMKNVMTIDDLAAMYSHFPFIKQSKIEVPIEDSAGNIRYIPARRNVVMGKEYMLRLKQYAEEKFSATSLSATNIRNENAKSKSNKEYKSLYSHTPIRFGEMELNSFEHIGPEKVIEVLLIHSVSPHARQLVEQFSTGDPYLMNIRLDNDSSNRSAEIAQTYLKTIGLRLNIRKIKKRKINPFMIHAMEFDQFAKQDPFNYIDPTNMGKKQLTKTIKELDEYKKDAMKRYEAGKLTDPFIVYDTPM